MGLLKAAKSIFKKLKALGRRAFKKETKDSLKWFFSLIKSTQDKFPKNAFKPTRDPFIGGMFHFIYDAKTKDKLPYWDAFPLVVPMEQYSDGFLGLNLHYLPPQMRAQLLDELIALQVKSPTVGAYMRVSYGKLKGTLKSELFKPCIKRYLTSHIRSQIIKIDSEQWETVTFIPSYQFKKASVYAVWRDAK